MIDILFVVLPDTLWRWTSQARQKPSGWQLINHADLRRGPQYPQRSPLLVHRDHLLHCEQDAV